MSLKNTVNVEKISAKPRFMTAWITMSRGNINSAEVTGARSARWITA